MEEKLLSSLRELLNRLDELKGKTSGTFEQGRKEAFMEALDIFKTNFSDVEVVREMLDFDIDERYS